MSAYQLALCKAEIVCALGESMKRPLILLALFIVALGLTSCYESSGFVRSRSQAPMSPATESTHYPLR